MTLDSRELATIILVAVIILLLTIFNRDRRELIKTVRRLVKSFFHWKIGAVVAALFAFISAIVVAARAIGLWSPALLKDTVTIGVFTGIPVLMYAFEAKAGTALIWHVTRRVLGIGALLLAYQNLVVLPLWAELMIQLILLFFVTTAVVAKNDPKTAPLGNGLEIATVAISLGLILVTTYRIMVNANNIDWSHELATFSISIYLPLAMIPFIYFIGVLGATERVLVNIRLRNEGARNLRAEAAFVVGTRGSLRYAANFSGSWLGRLSRESSLAGAGRIMREYRVVVRRNLRFNRFRRRQLRRRAGILGVDDRGLCLDRREFYETKEALKIIDITQAAAYRSRHRYWSDPAILIPIGGFRGLDDDHGVSIFVRDDDRAWAAWRLTPSGFYLGVGGVGDPEERWRYASTEAPVELPSNSAAGWVDIACNPDMSREWQTNDAPLDAA